MTWLVGSSTWSNIVNDICKLSCAEITDSLGHTPTVAERWVRDIDTTHNLLRMPASQDVDLAAVHQPAMRAGYWTLYSNPTLTSGASAPAPGTGPAQSVCQQTSPMPGPMGGGTGTFGRVLIFIYCITANTVVGNYSTAQFLVYTYDIDSGSATGSYQVSPNAAGVLTLPNVGYGIGNSQVTISDPSGIVQIGTGWCRGFTSTYLWGIDSWPMYSRNSGAWTFATGFAPPGVAGTDYDIINQAGPYGPSFAFATAFSGLGCKTATGANGARYVFSACPTTQLKVGLVNTANSAGSIDLLAFGVANDTVNGNVLRASGGQLVSQWLRLAQTASSVAGAMPVQYWMSVTATGIAVVLNADPAYTGGMTDGYFGLFTPGTAYDANDKFQNFVSASLTNVWLSANSQEGPSYGYTGQSYFRQYRCQDGSHGARDWQTYWMRSDFFNSSQFGNNGYPLQSQTVYLGDYWSSYGGGDTRQGSPYDSAKPNFDGNWWLYGYRLVEVSGPSATNGTTSPTNEQIGFPRGAINDRFWHLPGLGWGNGDELTDSVSGTKYFLVQPDAPGLPGRLNYTTGAWRGGTAIAEL